MDGLMAGIRKHVKSFTWLAIVALTLMVLLNSYSIMKISKNVDEIVNKEKEAAKPALAEATLVNPANCEKCGSLEKELSSLKSYNMEITKENTVSGKDAAGLIAKYGLKKLPAIIVTGEINKLSLNGFRKSADGLVLEASFPPYQDAVTGQVKGIVKAIAVNEPSCTQCPNMTVLLNGLEGSGVEFSAKEQMDSESAKGLIQKYNITKLPSLILSSDFKEYEFSNNWNSLGHVAEDGNYVLDLSSPPYYDVATKKVLGKVKFTGIYDKGCTECYNLTEVHMPILLRFGVWIGEGKNLDANDAEAKSLITKYNITSVPTIILSREALDYRSLVNAWQPVGTIESDGSLVFRANEVLGLGYKDLASGEVVKPAEKPNA